jgi:hypothetical protein
LNTLPEVFIITRSIPVCEGPARENPEILDVITGTIEAVGGTAREMTACVRRRRSCVIDAGRNKGKIYDCDGVLVDSVESNVAYYNHILTRFDLPVLDESWMNLVLTGTGKGVLEALFKGSPFIGDALELQRQLPPEAFLDLVRPEPQVHDVLRQMRMRYHTAVATNRGKSLVPFSRCWNGKTSSMLS